jgi:hypothetical protein
MKKREVLSPSEVGATQKRHPSFLALSKKVDKFCF